MVKPSVLPAAPELTKFWPHDEPMSSWYGSFAKAMPPYGELTLTSPVQSCHAHQLLVVVLKPSGCVPVGERIAYSALRFDAAVVLPKCPAALTASWPSCVCVAWLGAAALLSYQTPASVPPRVRGVEHRARRAATARRCCRRDGCGGHGRCCGGDKRDLRDATNDGGVSGHAAGPFGDVPRARIPPTPGTTPKAAVPLGLLCRNYVRFVKVLTARLASNDSTVCRSRSGVRRGRIHGLPCEPWRQRHPRLRSASWRQRSPTGRC